ncbi:putative cupredoxin, phytocyanin [Helianthus anomalus]
MAEGRGSAMVAMVVLCLPLVASQCEVARATTYVVGDDNGWTFNVAGWENGKNFNAGDVLGILSTSYHHFSHCDSGMKIQIYVS